MIYQLNPIPHKKEQNKIQNKKKHGRFGNFVKLKILMALVVQKCWNFFWGESKLIFKEKLFLTNEYNIPQSYVFYAQQIHVNMDMNMNSFYRTSRDFLKVDKLKPISSLHRMKSEQPSSVNSSLKLQCPLPSQQVLST